jgi:tRNA(Arg) A34 adenosine deaminase TadA
MSTGEEYFDLAFEQAFNSVRNNIGGPFGAVIVKDGVIIGKGGNRVISSHDPTAHAEIVAIRDACTALKTFDLTGADIYSTCEPCPMCLSAIYWANINKVFYCLTRHDAADIGFRDNHLYEELPLDPSDRRIPFIKTAHPSGKLLFSEWMQKMDKVPY